MHWHLVPVCENTLLNFNTYFVYLSKGYNEYLKLFTNIVNRNEWNFSIVLRREIQASFIRRFIAYFNEITWIVYEHINHIQADSRTIIWRLTQRTWALIVICGDGPTVTWPLWRDARHVHVRESRVTSRLHLPLTQRTHPPTNTLRSILHVKLRIYRKTHK